MLKTYCMFCAFLLQDPDNGYVLRDDLPENLTVGSIVKFKCRLGYILHGSDISTCQEGGQWSHNNRTCARKLRLARILSCCCL